MTEVGTRFVVGVAGGSSSGKTTFARRLLEALPSDSAVLLHHDSYYRDLSHLGMREREQVNFDHPDALESELLCDHIESLRHGRAVDKPIYDFTTHCRTAEVQPVAPAPILIVEGILVLSDQRLRDSADLKLFVEAPADIRLLRRFERDVEERGRTVAQIAAQYTSTVRPMHDRFVEPAREHADLIVPGVGDGSAALRATADALRCRL